MWGQDRARLDQILEVLNTLPPSQITPVRLALRSRLLAERASQSGDHDAARQHGLDAAERLRALRARPLLVGALLDLVRRHDDAEALAEAREICRQLGATRWLERIDARSSVTA
jgi:hypothetical protein